MSYSVTNGSTINTRNKPIGGWLPWIMCAIGALFYSYEYFLRIGPSVMAPNLMSHYQIHAAMFGFISAFYYYAYVPMQLPVGVMMDHYGPRKLLSLACLICVLGTVIFTVSHSLILAAAGRLLIGFGSAFAFVGVLKLATIWLPPNKLAMVCGLAAALGTIGAMCGDISLTHMVQQIGWQNTLYICAGIGVLLTLIIWAFVQDRYNCRYSKAHHGSRDIKLGLMELAYIAKNKQIWINGLYGCFIYLPTTVLAEQWGPLYLQQAHHFTAKQAAMGNSLLFLGFTIGAPLFGYISDEIRKRRMPMLLGALAAATCAALVIYGAGLSKFKVEALLFMLGIFYGSQALVFAVGREVSAKHAAGTAIAFTNMLVMLGGMFLQPLVGALLDWHNTAIRLGHPHAYTLADYQFALSILPIGILIAAVLAYFLKETNAEVAKPTMAVRRVAMNVAE